MSVLSRAESQSLRMLEDDEAPHTLGGASDTLRYISFADLARGWVGLRKPMDL